MPAPALIQVEGLSVIRCIPILQNISWAVRKGEHWIILGPNGSGKTSLLTALTAYLTPTRGKITVCRQTYGKSDWIELRKKIGMVSSSIRQQIGDGESALSVVASGKNAIINNHRPIGRKDLKLARSILRKIQCVNLAERPWLFLSQGERQRILIGRALMADFKILILDEPCAGLDPVAREQLLHFLASLTRRKSCPPLVLVTHHVEEILPSFTHVLMLDHGRVLASGPVKTTLTSARLSSAFQTPIRLVQVNGRYSLKIQTRGTGKSIT